MMFNLFKKNVNMKEVGQNKALTWSCYGAKSRITSIMEGKWSDNGTIVCSDWCGHSMAYGRLAGVTGTALRKIAAVFCLLMAVGVSDVWGEDYTFSAGTTIYYDFRDLTGAAGVNWWKGGSDLAYFVGIGKGCVVAYTFPDEKTATIGSTVLFKTQNNSYNPITISSAPTSGENVVKVSADGTSYTWAQASARTFASGDTIFLKDTWDDDGNDANWVPSDGTLYACFSNDRSIWTSWSSCEGAPVTGYNWRDKNGVYSFIVPGSSQTYTYVKFARGKNSGSDIYNETLPQSPMVGHDMFLVAGSNEAKYGEAYTGSWCSAITFYGTNNSWNAKTNPLINGKVTLALSARSTYEFKIYWTASGAAYGTASSSAIVSSDVEEWTLATENSNIILTTAAAGDYTFKFDWATKKLVVDYPAVTHPSADYCYMIHYADWRTHNIYLKNSSSSRRTNDTPGQPLPTKITLYSATESKNVDVYYYAPGDYSKFDFSANDGSKRTGDQTTSFGKYMYNSGSSWVWGAFGFTVTLDNQSPSVSGATSTIVEFNGAAPTTISSLPTKTGYTFDGYYSGTNGTGVKVINADGTWVSNATGYTSSGKWIHEGGTATLYAKWGREFSLVTSSVTLQEGDEIVVLKHDGTKAMGADNTNNRIATANAMYASDMVIVDDDGPIQVITIEKENVAETTYNLFKVGTDSYLYGQGGKSNNNLKTGTKSVATTSNNGYWSISVEEGTNIATVTSLGQNKTLQNNGDIFSCYSSSQQAIKLYYCTSPYLYVTSADLTEFKCVEGLGASFAQAVSVKGYNLTGNITVNCPTGYELSSTSQYSGFSSEDLTLTAVSNKVDATFYIRLKDSEDGDFDGPLTIDGGGIAPKSIDLDGTVYAVGVDEGGYKLLTDANDIFPEDKIVIMNEAGDQILSTSGSSDVRYSTTTGFTYAGTAVKVSSDDVQVITIEGTHDEWKFGTGSSKYLYTGASSNELKNNTWTYASKANAIWNISINNSNGVATVKANKEETSSTNKNWLLYYYNSGTNPRFACYHSAQTSNPKLYAKPSATANVCGWPSGLSGFSTQSGTASTAQSFSVKARNITSGDVTVTAPSGYEVCLTESGTYTSSVTISPVSNSVAPTMVYVRIAYNTRAGDYNDSISISATGAKTRKIALSGTVTHMTVTYHAATMATDKVVEVSYGDDIEEEYIPDDCATDRLFIGWSTTEVATQQTAPAIASTDGTLEDITANMNLYAVFASRNGSYGHDYADDFNGYETSSSFGNSTPRTYGIWKVTYGKVNNTGDITTRMGSNAIALQKEKSAYPVMQTSQKIYKFTGIDCKIATTDNSIIYYIEYSANGISDWTRLNEFTSHDYRPAQTYYLTKTGDPVDAYVRFIIYSGTDKKQMYIDDVTIHSKPHDWVLTDYSTSCTKPATVSVTFNKNDGIGDVPSAPATGGSITLPTLTKANYRFNGYKVQASGQDEAAGIYYAGESYTVNHDVTLTAQWTQLFTVSDPTFGVTSYKDITTASIPHTFRVVASEISKRPVVNAVSDAKFNVTITGAELDDTDSVYTFVYSYTPDAFGSGSGAATNTATVTFRDPVSGTLSAPITLRGRSLPEEFVIAVKNTNDSKWYALPNTLPSTSGGAQIPPVEISVDNTTTPTAVTYAPSTTIYKAVNRADNSHATAFRFTTTGGNYLQVSGSAGTNNMWLSNTNSAKVQDWLLESTDFNSYTLTIPSNSGNESKKLCLYTPSSTTYIGYSSSPTDAAIYLLPVNVSHFIGGVEGHETEWNQSGNWEGGSLPSSSSIVRIFAPLTIATSEKVQVDELHIIAGGRTSHYNSGNSDCTGRLTIEAGGELIVNNTIRKVSDATSLGTLVATDNEDIIIHSDKTHGLGALVMGQHDGSNYATVHFYSKSHYGLTDSTSVNQYIGTPFGNRPPMIYQFYNSWMYKLIYSNDLGNICWDRIGGDTLLNAFQGYCVISAENEMNPGHMYTMSGQLVASTNHTIDLYCNENGKEGSKYSNENMLANSWMAPIRIKAFKESDFTKAWATIYIFNSGSIKNYNHDAWSVTSDKEAGPSQYTAYTIGTAGNAVIPAMQAFSVFTNGETAEEGASITLTFDSLVYAPAVATDATHADITPNRAPRRLRIEDEEANKMRIFVQAASGYRDMLYMWEHESFSVGFENGWDGHKLFGEGVAPQLYAITPDGKMAVNCVPSYEGVQIGFKAGEKDAVYTFTFEYEADAEVLYLHDKQTGEYTRVLSGNSYAFGTSDKNEHARFELTRNAPQVATGDIPVSGEEQKVHGTYKYVEDDKLFIYRDGRLYDATGILVK